MKFGTVRKLHEENKRRKAAILFHQPSAYEKFINVMYKPVMVIALILLLRGLLN